ncbi:MAG: hypothetical protein ACOC3Y_01735 [Desulfohalobiaceae bacterium]
MYKKALLVVLFLSLCAPALANPICDKGRDQARSDAIDFLKQKYPDRYTQVRPLLKHMMQDYQTICELPEDPRSLQVLKELEKDYPDFIVILRKYKARTGFCPEGEDPEQDCPSLEDGEKMKDDSGRKDVYIPSWVW